MFGTKISYTKKLVYLNSWIKYYSSSEKECVASKFEQKLREKTPIGNFIFTYFSLCFNRIIRPLDL